MKKNKQLQKIVRLLVKTSFKNDRMIESQVVKSIKILKSLPRYEAIQALLEYLKGIRAVEREHTLSIETTTSLSPAQIKKLKKIMERKTKITKILVRINKEMMGGFKLRVGDEIWDESILGKIQSIKEAIISS